jgi:hypothetical protein
MNKVVALLMCTLISGGSAVARNCDAPDTNSAEFTKAIRLVHDLPELRSWASSHSFPVAFDGFGLPMVREGRCYLSVGVLASRPERLERWQNFYVNIAHRSVLVQDTANGEVISLKQWRLSNKPDKE